MFFLLKYFFYFCMTIMWTKDDFICNCTPFFAVFFCAEHNFRWSHIQTFIENRSGVLKLVGMPILLAREILMSANVIFSKKFTTAVVIFSKKSLPNFQKKNNYSKELGLIINISSVVIFLKILW